MCTPVGSAEGALEGADVGLTVGFEVGVLEGVTNGLLVGIEGAVVVDEVRNAVTSCQREIFECINLCKTLETPWRH